MKFDEFHLNWFQWWGPKVDTNVRDSSTNKTLTDLYTNYESISNVNTAVAVHMGTSAAPPPQKNQPPKTSKGLAICIKH